MKVFPRPSILDSYLATESAAAKTIVNMACVGRVPLPSLQSVELAKVSDAEMASLNITTNAWHPEWNYTISPRPKT